jgi:mono/diheme cytochrome c family protein
MLAYEKAKPVFDKFCANCHTQGRPGARKGTLAHLDTTVYPFTGHHSHETTATVRRVLGVGGGKATMPMNKPGAVQGEDLALIIAWADAFDASHK